MEGEVIEASADSWDTAAREGQKFISRKWARLLPATKTTLAADGYDNRGRFAAYEDSALSDSRNVEYALGVFAEAAAAKVPSKKGDRIPGCLAGDEVLRQASALIASEVSTEPVFAELAICAILRKQTASALEFLYFRGGTNEVATTSAIWEIGKAIVKVVLGIGLPAAVGGGLAYASQGNGVAASLCAYFAFAGVSVLRSSKNEEVAAKELAAYRKWNSLLYNDFHIGTGHGLRIQLEEMQRQDIHVPSALIDLCAMLHQRSPHTRENAA